MFAGIKVMIGNITAIYRRELLSYFASPLAYGIAGIFWLLCGIFFAVILQNTIAIAATADIQAQPIDIPYLFLQDFLGILSILSLFILPTLSMGLYAEERKLGTLELLATSPLTNWAVATGKLLAVITFYLTMVLPVFTYMGLALGSATPPLSLALIATAYLGLVLLAAAILSLGMFISSLTSSTILAAILSFGLVFVLWILDSLSRGLTGWLGEVVRHLSLLKHYVNLSQGILDGGSLLLFISYIVLGLFLTAQSIEALRFQRS